MTKKNLNPDSAKSENNEKSSINVVDQYQDHITSFYDSLLVQETIRRKELGLPFSKQDAEGFLKEIQQALAKKKTLSDDPSSTQAYSKFKNPLIEKAEQEGKQTVLKQMQSTPIEGAIQDWLKTLPPNTCKVYERGIKDLIEAELIRLYEKQSLVKSVSRTLYDFANVPHDLLLEKILSHSSWSSSIKTRNATAYKNLIKYLRAKTEGIITFLTTKSMFPKQRTKEPKKLLSSDQINRVLALLKEENPRDYCLVYLYLFSDRKLNETLKFRKKDLDQEKNQNICNLLPYFHDLNDDDYLFRTRNGKPLDPMQISRTLQRIYDKTNIPPVSLRDLKKISSSELNFIKAFSHIPESEKKKKWFRLIEPLVKVRLALPNQQTSKLLLSLEKQQGFGTWKSIKLLMELAFQNVTNSEQIFSRSSQIRTDPDPDGIIDDMFAEARVIPYLLIKGLKNIVYKRRDGLDFSAEFNNKTYNIEVAYVRGPTFKTQKHAFTTEITKLPIFQLEAKKLVNRLKTIYSNKQKQVLKHGGSSSNTIIFILSDLDEMHKPWLDHDLFQGKHPLEGFVLSRKIPTVLCAPGTLYEPPPNSLDQNFKSFQPFSWEKFKLMISTP